MPGGTPDKSLQSLLALPHVGLSPWSPLPSFPAPRHPVKSLGLGGWWAGMSEHPEESKDCVVTTYFPPLLYLTVCLRATSCLHGHRVPATTWAISAKGPSRHCCSLNNKCSFQRTASLPFTAVARAKWLVQRGQLVVSAPLTLSVGGNHFGEWEWLFNATGGEGKIIRIHKKHKQTPNYLAIYNHVMTAGNAVEGLT